MQEKHKQQSHIIRNGGDEQNRKGDNTRAPRLGQWLGLMLPLVHAALVNRALRFHGRAQQAWARFLNNRHLLVQADGHAPSRRRGLECAERRHGHVMCAWLRDSRLSRGSACNIFSVEVSEGASCDTKRGDTCP